MTNFGSNVIFAGTGGGKKKGKKYKWVASASTKYPNTIIINKHSMWTKKPLNHIIRKVTGLMPHETIHNILWANGLDPYGGYDVVRTKILHNKKISLKMHDIYYRCT